MFQISSPSLQVSARQLYKAGAVATHKLRNVRVNLRHRWRDNPRRNGAREAARDATWLVVEKLSRLPAAYNVNN